MRVRCSDVNNVDIAILDQILVRPVSLSWCILLLWRDELRNELPRRVYGRRRSDGCYSMLDILCPSK